MFGIIAGLVRPGDHAPSWTGRVRMSTRPHPPSGALAIRAAARAALPEIKAATPRAPRTSPQPGPLATPPSVPLGGATGRNTAQQTRTFCRANPRRAGVTPRQMIAARLLLSGRRVAEVA